MLRRQNARDPPLGERVARLEGKVDLLVEITIVELGAIVGLIGLTLVHFV